MTTKLNPRAQQPVKSGMLIPPRRKLVRGAFSFIAALLLATGAARADDPKSAAETYCHLLKLEGKDYQSCLEHPELWTTSAPSSPYAEKDYMIDCVSYKWKERHFHLKRGDACVFRNCRGNPPEICAEGNWGRVPRKLLREQLRDLGRVPRAKYVKANSK
jgi:hypothetical protein